jgi:hypothetical protein
MQENDDVPPLHRVLPDTIGLLKQLEEFNVRDNNISKLPSSVSQLHSLNIFNLGTISCSSCTCI